MPMFNQVQFLTLKDRQGWGKGRGTGMGSERLVSAILYPLFASLLLMAAASLL